MSVFYGQYDNNNINGHKIMQDMISVGGQTSTTYLTDSTSMGTTSHLNLQFQ